MSTINRFRTRTCGQCSTDKGVRLVEIVEQGTGPGGGRYACPACVPIGRGVLERETGR